MKKNLFDWCKLIYPIGAYPVLYIFFFFNLVIFNRYFHHGSKNETSHEHIWLFKSLLACIKLSLMENQKI